jgi:hypothetical protein
VQRGSWWPAENTSGGDYLAEGQTRIVTKSDFCAVAHGFGTSDVAVNRNRPTTPYAERCHLRRSGLVGETSVVKRGRKLVFKSVGRVLAAKDVTAGAHHVRGGSGAAARDGSRILRGGHLRPQWQDESVRLGVELGGFCVVCEHLRGEISISISISIA